VKICYVARSFSSESRATISTANAILEEYAAQGYDLTLRQLYYQFVSRGMIANKDAEYKRLGSVINDARLAGEIDWDHITDRTRNLRSNPHWESPRKIVEACAEQFQVDKWANQPNYLEAWIEKDALLGVLEVASEPLDVPYFSCRGYTSQSEMWTAAMRIKKQLSSGKAVHVLHFGDLDPSGVDMSRDIRERIEMFLSHHLGTARGFELKRIALNMEQVKRYSPPPNPAKVTDSRAIKYITAYGYESWELDALEPRLLTSLIQEAVFALRDQAMWDSSTIAENEARERLRDAAQTL